jgi:F-type H+-transporting ATPase subunit epsilon
MLKLEIVTPEKKVLDEPVDSVTVPTATGEIGILPNHAPLISALRSGILSYTSKGATDRLVISGGFVEVSHDQVAILTDVAERADEIDPDAARAEREAARSALAAAANGTIEELESEQERFERALARVDITRNNP